MAVKTQVKGEKRLQIFERDKWTCWYCACSVKRFTNSTEIQPNTAVLDHLIPESVGGANDVDNLVTACWRCNSIKKTKDLEEYRLYLRYQINPTGQAITCLRTSLGLASTPFDKHISQAIEWLEDQMPKTVFFGELIRDDAQKGDQS
ncbi:MAG: HNH endonuclease [Acidobacteria bacterium]|nr:HNH endonuclease [Acidobacteriota bacterium]